MDYGPHINGCVKRTLSNIELYGLQISTYRLGHSLTFMLSLHMHSLLNLNSSGPQLNTDKVW